MIATLALAFQVAAAGVGTAAPAAGPLVVKDATRSASIPLVEGENGPLLRADLLRPIVPLTVSHLMGDRWMLIVNGAAIQVEPGIRLATVGDERYQLAGAPELRKGALYVPLQLVVELLPRIAGNLAWDADRFELRAFSVLTRRGESDGTVIPAGQPRASGPPPAAASPPIAAPASGPESTRVVTARPETAPSPAETPRSSAPAADAKSGAKLRTRRLVVVDAGHGGPDAGMHGPIGGGPQILEKNVTLTVAKHVGAALIARGVAVKYTRTTDTLIALDDRGRIANDAHADLFVSIHVNAANPGWKDPGAARGFETYFLAEAKTEDARRVEQMENEVVKFEAKSSAQAGDPLSFVLNDMAQNEHLRESNELAELIQRRLGRVHPAPNRGVKQAGFRVLVTAFMPAVLVEIGFGTNPADATFITDPAHVDEIAGAVSDAVLEYLRRYERRVSSTAPSPSSGSLGGGRR